MWNKVLETRIIPILCFILGVSICVSTAAMSASYVAIAILVCFKTNFLKSLREAFKDKLVVSCFIFYMVFVVGCLWSVAPFHDSFKMLTRIHGFLLAPLFYIAFKINDSAKQLLKGFLFGAVLSAGLSVLSFIFHQHIFYGIRDNTWVVFHGHILHNAFLAVAGGFLLLGAVLKTLPSKLRIWCLVLYFLCLVDVLFIVVGRTGQVLYIIVSMFIIIYHFRLRGILFILIIASVSWPLIYFSPAIKSGIKSYKSDMSKYQEGDSQTSMGLRLVFHKVSTSLFKQKPLIGYGTGSFTQVYRKYVEEHKIGGLATTNPHRDILWIGVETGILGIILFAIMIFMAVFESLKLSYYFKGASLSLIFGYLLASAQNSFFIDNVTGMAFVFILLSLVVMGSKGSQAGLKHES